ALAALTRPAHTRFRRRKPAFLLQRSSRRFGTGGPMLRIIRIAALALFALPLAAQQNIAIVAQAQQSLALADSAGAQIYAKSLFDDAAYRVRFAQENINSPDTRAQSQAQMRAREAIFAADAARAKARWLSTNATISNLQSDIRRFGGTSNTSLLDEDPGIDYHRGS